LPGLSFVDDLDLRDLVGGQLDPGQGFGELLLEGRDGYAGVGTG
jgi:hypothetical protein